MRLDQPDLGRRDAGVAVGCLERRHLAGQARRHRPFAAAVVVHAEAAHDRPDPVAGRHRVLDPLDEKAAGPLAEHEAVGARVERAAHLGARDRADPREGHHVVGRHREVDAAHQGSVTGAGAEVEDRLAERDQRRGACRVGGEGRPAQVERLRHVGGRHVQHLADHAVGLQRRDVLDQEVPRRRHAGGEAAERLVLHLGGEQARGGELVVLGDGDPGEDAGPAAGQGVGAKAGVLDRGARGVEEEALLRVHRARAARQDAEELGAELLDGVDAGEPPRVGVIEAARVRVVERAVVPAARRDVADRHLTPAHQAGELGQIGGAGQPAAHADDGDPAIGHWMCPASFSQASVGASVSRADRKLTPSSRSALLASTNQ